MAGLRPPQLALAAADLLIRHSARFAGQADRRLAERIAPSTSGPQVAITEPQPILQWFARVGSFHVEQRGGEPRIVSGTHTLSHVFLVGEDEIAATFFREDVRPPFSDSISCKPTPATTHARDDLRHTDLRHIFVAVATGKMARRGNERSLARPSNRTQP